MLKEKTAKCEQLHQVNEFLSKQLEAASKKALQDEREIKRLTKEIGKMQESLLSPTPFTERMENALKEALSVNQIALITKERKQVRWTTVEISKAFTLRYFSKRAYLYMLIDLKYPLAFISTLQRYAQKLNLKQGILEDVLVFVGNLAESFNSCECECVLSFDEMKVCKILEYDPAADEIMGPHNYIQVVMARGLLETNNFYRI